MRHDERGHDRAHLQRVAAALGLVDVERRLVALGGADHRHGRAHRLHHGLARRRERGKEDGHRLGHDAQRVDLRRERLPLRGRGQATLEQQVPHVLERELVGQLDGVVLAVVVEALEAPYVAHRRLRHDDALESGRRLDVRRVDDGLDLRDAHQRRGATRRRRACRPRPRGGGGTRARRTRGRPLAPTAWERSSRPAASSTR